MSSNTNSQLSTANAPVIATQNELLKKIDLPVIQENHQELLSLETSQDLDTFLKSIESKPFEDQVVLSQAAFMAVNQEITTDNWSNNAANFLGYVMAISGHTQHGKMKISNKDLSEALKSFVEDKLSDTLDYDGLIASLLTDFNDLAQKGYENVVNLVLFDLVLASLDLDGRDLDLGHREGWYEILQQRAVDLRNGFSSMTSGWSYDDQIDSIDQIDLEELEAFEPINERRYEIISLDLEQINDLMINTDFLPEEFYTNRLLRAMIHASGFCAKTGMDIINRLASEKETLAKLQLEKIISKSKKLITRATASLFYKELAKNLRDMTALNMKIWNRIHNILHETQDVQLEKITTQVTAEVGRILDVNYDGEEIEETDILNDSFNFDEFMDALDD